MDVSIPIFEAMLIYVGHFICLCSALYMAKVGHAKIGTLFLVAFLLQIQVGFFVPQLDAEPATQAACWMSSSSYYECLPVLNRVSIHAAQVGTLLLGMAVFLCARVLRAGKLD
jgi:hypothetical protein